MSKHNHASNWKGKKQSATYNSWRSMIQRCTNPNHEHYLDYGGRGLQIYAPWYDFKNFLEDMGIRPEGTSLDRVNNESGYYPANCMWATQQQQRRNSRSVKLNDEYAYKIRVLKESGMKIKELSVMFDVSESAIKNVLYRGDWQ